MKSNRYDKNYFEKYARLTIKYIYPYFEKNFVNGDKPDIQNIKENIGIEVCRAENDNDGKFNSFVNEHIKSDKSDEELNYLLCKRLKIKGKFPNLIKTISGCRIFNQHLGLIDFDSYISKVIMCINNKNKKINIYNKEHVWKYLGLYIFAGVTFENHDIKNVISKIPKTKEHFDFYIINCMDTLYFIKYNGEFTSYKLSDKELSLIKTEAQSQDDE